MNRIKTKERTCAACGELGLRSGSKYCSTCGKLTREDYQPLDTIRASYGLQGKRIELPETIMEEPTDLFEQNKNQASQTAWACVVYSMVPYLGILFIPFSFIIGGAGYLVSYRKPQLGGRRLAIVCVTVSILVLAIQLVLWWLLYIVPELGVTI